MLSVNSGNDFPYNSQGAANAPLFTRNVSVSQSVSDSVLWTVRRRFQRTLTTGTRSRRLRRISVGSRFSLSAGFSVLSAASQFLLPKLKFEWIYGLYGYVADADPLDLGGCVRGL